MLVNLCILVERKRVRERGVKTELDREVSRKARQRIQEKARQRDSDN